MQISRVAETVNGLFDQCDRFGTLQLAVDDTAVSGRYVHIGGRKLLHFGNCSYMGLENDPRLQDAAKAAVDRFGVCFSMTRTFAHVPLVEQLEEGLSRMFGGRPAVVATTTTLAHLSALPVFIPEGDVAILDYMAHASLQLTGNALRGAGVQVETIQHNSMESLEKKLASIQGSNRIWYIADGVYSMFGNLAPFEALNELMDRDPRLHLYIDDAHGVAWCGSNGTGSAFDHIRHKDRLFLAVSLNKGLGTMGGAVILPNTDAARILRRTGTNLIFNFPVPPALLAAACESARLMCTPEMEGRRQSLMGKVRRFLRGCRELELPLVDWSETPVFYLKIGRPQQAMEVGRKLMERGIYTNTVGYPAVPLKSAGLRITLTHHTQTQDLDFLLDQCADVVRAPEKAVA